MTTAILIRATLVEQPKGTELEYRVIAINKSGEGSPSNTLMGVLQKIEYRERWSWILMKKKRKKYFLEGLAYKRTNINPDDVIYRRDVQRPRDKEVIEEVEKQEFKHNRVAIYMSGTIIVAAASKVIFGVELSFPVLLGVGAVVGTLLFFLDRWIAECLRKEPEKPRDEQKQ